MAILYALNKKSSKCICNVPKSSIYWSHWVCFLRCSSPIKWCGSITATNFSLPAINCIIGGGGGSSVSCFVFTFFCPIFSYFSSIFSLVVLAGTLESFFLKKKPYYSLYFACENTLRMRYRRIPCIT